ncbi:MAG: GtrA family protein [Candidatus Pacebacteria bacterium]|nr:GtrA family protein [Candidatus Paceibacterota bacterium]
MKKSDIVISFLIGEIVALYFISFLKDIPFFQTGITALVLKSLPIVFPLLSVFCLWIAYLIGKKILFVFQLAKFCLIGALATIFDLGTLALFISLTSTASGLGYSFFKGVSFIIATIAKYFADKFWAFEKKETHNMTKEFTQFFIVTIIGLAINVGAASFIVNQIGPQFGLPSNAWANIGGIGAVFITFIWNFIGYKFIVFKK